MPEDQLKFVLVTEGYLKKLEEDHLLLECLKAEGLDNWDGYSRALRKAHGEYEDE